MKDKILESAIRQIKIYGLRRFTMDDIAEDLRISKKTLYQYFSSKKELIKEVVDGAVELEKQITDEALAGVDNWFDKLDSVLSVHIYNNLPYSRLDEITRYFPEERISIKRIIEYKVKVLRELLQQGLEEGRLRGDINLQIVILALEKVFFIPTDEEFLKQNDLTVNQLLQQLKTVFFYGSLVAENKEDRKARLES